MRWLPPKVPGPRGKFLQWKRSFIARIVCSQWCLCALFDKIQDLFEPTASDWFTSGNGFLPEMNYKPASWNVKVSWSNCLGGKTLPGFSPRSVLGHPSLALSLRRCLFSARSRALGHLNEADSEHVWFIVYYCCSLLVYGARQNPCSENFSLGARGKKPLEKAKYIYLFLPI